MLQVVLSAVLVSSSAAAGWQPPADDAAPRLAIVGATVIDGTGAPPVTDAVILVEDERIVRVAPRAEVAIPAGTERFDGAGKWVMPGLVDAHVHFFQSGSLYTRPDVIDLRDVRSYAREQQWIRDRTDRTLCRHLESGVTSVVDVGGPFWNFDVRERARTSELAPRVAVAGPLLSPEAPDALQTDDPAILAARTPEEARALAQQQLERDPDLVKLWFIAQRGRDPASFMPVVRAVIAHSHAAGVRVVVHATQLEIARLAVDAGADVLAHSIDDREVDDTFVDAVTRRGVVYTTTLLVSRRYEEVLHDRVRLNGIERRLGDPEVIASWDDLARLSKTRRPPRRDPSTFGPSREAMSNLVRLHEAGVVIAAGSDAGNIGTLHGPSLHRELELMVQAGLTPSQVLVAATRGGATVMGREDQLGTLEPGKLADFLILDASPLERIENTGQIDRIVKGGRLLNPRGLCDALD